jgi:ArsR family transcriptional regulator, arsenate/arsenite/antimonite-responsive transcriptional repressor
LTLVSTTVNMGSMKLIELITEECCAPVLRQTLSQEEAEGTAAALKVVADPARLRILNFISSQPSGEACVCNLTEPLGLSQPTVSHHLKVLADAGLVEREQRGRWAFFRLDPERLQLLRDALAVPAAVPMG